MNSTGYVLLGYAMLIMLLASISIFGISSHWVFVGAEDAVELAVIVGLMVVYVEDRIGDVEEKIKDVN